MTSRSVSVDVDFIPPALKEWSQWAVWKRSLRNGMELELTRFGGRSYTLESNRDRHAQKPTTLPRCLP